ncbi:MAG: hypothetical protein AB3N63_09410 [Puniceicoccaceae bacterium]
MRKISIVPLVSILIVAATYLILKKNEDSILRCIYTERFEAVLFDRAEKEIGKFILWIPSNETVRKGTLEVEILDSQREFNFLGQYENGMSNFLFSKSGESMVHIWSTNIEDAGFGFNFDSEEKSQVITWYYNDISSGGNMGGTVSLEK